MRDGRWWGLPILSLLIVACTNTMIDLTPDSGDAGGPDDVVGPDTDVGRDGPGIVILPPPPCGNRMLDPGEECDDGNQENDDTCTWDCRLGPGEPVPGPDPAARAYVAVALPIALAPVEHPPQVGAPETVFPMATLEADLVGSWLRTEFGTGLPASLSTRFMASDGSLAREDVVVTLEPDSTFSPVASASVGSNVLLAYRTGHDGIWRAAVSVEAGLASPPTLLVRSETADLPALAGLPAGYVLASYDGNDSMPCVHDASGPSRILLRRLTPDGTTDGMPEPVAIESEIGAWTAPDLAAGDDDSVGVLWWRASIDGSGTCTLRFGSADAGLTTLADGGVVGPGISGRIATAERSYRIVWKTTSFLGTRQLGFASFDGGAVLLAPPVFHDLSSSSFAGDVELAAGDHGLVAVVAGYHSTTGVRLYFLRTDLLGRAVRMPDAVQEVDPTCHQDLDCSLGPYNVVWSGDAFLVIYFVTLNLGEPTETTEMRMVRLVPET